MTVQMPKGDLDRVVSHDPEDEWPTLIEVTAYWRGENGRGRRKSISISADEFFGRGAYGAPLSGDNLIAKIERLRKS